MLAFHMPVFKMALKELTAERGEILCSLQGTLADLF
jgi:hypothetical protein